MKSTLLHIITIALCSTCYSAYADWKLVGSESSLNFISTKNQNISEIQQFKSLQGELNSEGALKIDIALASIDSGIAIRDTRMQEKLFLVDKFPTANLTAQLPNSVLTLTKGNSIAVTLPAELSVMGLSKTIKVAVQVSRKADNGFVATSIQPILISATDFALKSGIETLQKLAGLNSIGLTVPVSFNLVFVAH